MSTLHDLENQNYICFLDPQSELLFDTILKAKWHASALIPLGTRVNYAFNILTKHLIFQNLPLWSFDWDAPAIENDMFFLRHFLRGFFAPFLSSKFLFFNWMGKSIGLLQKKMKEGQNYYSKFSISHCFQNFQLFFCLLDEEPKSFNFQCEVLLK